MKCLLYRIGNAVCLTTPDIEPDHPDQILGEVELDVKPVKKWVTKEFKCVEVNFWTQYGEFARVIPHNARNIKITYEVEE